MTAVLTEMMELLGGGIATLATAIGGGIKTAVEGLFLTTSSTGAVTLSTFGGIICIFGGVALAVGITTKITNWVMSLGN